MVVVGLTLFPLNHCKRRTFGEKSADNVAKFGGSWGFLFCLGGFIGGWALLNSLILPVGARWDEYPWILLNLILSMLASTQAPVIMMSQNRQAALDRLQSDYVSRAILRNENQTRHVDAKLDHLISYQWKRLLEIQEIQVQLLQEVVGGGGGGILERRGSRGSMGGGVSGVGGGRNGGGGERFWSGESLVEEFTFLLVRRGGGGVAAADEAFIFSHWHMEGWFSLVFEK